MKKLLLLTLALCIGLCAHAQLGGGTPLPPGGGWPLPGGGTGWGSIPIFNGGLGTGSGSLNPGFPGKPQKPNTGDRSATVEAVEAWIDYDFGQVALCFAYELGEVDVWITNAMGQAVASYTCDTNAEWQIMLQMPTTEGHYTLHIEGVDYAGYGEFDM